MQTFRHTLVPIDFSGCSRAALAAASRVIDTAGRLTLLHVRPYRAPQALGDSVYAEEPPPPIGLAPASLIGELAALADPLRAKASDVQLLVRDGDPTAEILEYAETSHADLIVLGTHGYRGFDRFVLGSVTQRVCRRATCSVLAVRETGDAPPPAGPLTHVLCAADLASSSATTVDAAVGLARTAGARLTVLHVIDPWHWDDPWPIARGDEHEVRRLLADLARERVTALLADHDAPQGTEVQVAFGRPHTEIVRVAAEQAADVVVVGAHVGPATRFFFGSTADYLLRNAPCPIFVTRVAPARRREDDTEDVVAARH